MTIDERPAAAGRDRRRRLAVVGLPLGLAVAVAAVVLVVREQAPQPVRPTLVIQSSPLSPGTPFTIGALAIHYLPGQDIEILAVEPTVSDNVEVLGALAAFPIPREGYSFVQGSGGFPPDATDVDPESHMDYVPATGRVFAWEQVGREDRDYQGLIEVLVGVRVTSGDLGGVNGVSVTYRTGGKVQHEVFPWALVLCVGPDACRLEDEAALEELGLLPSS